MKSWIMPVLLAVALIGGSFALREVAYAQGAAEVAPVDAGVSAPGPDGATSAPAVASAFNPLAWDWANIFMLVLTILGALVGILRVLAPMTKSKKDDWLLGKLEWLTDLLAKIIVPKQYRADSLGGGKGGGPVADDNVKFPK